jgi:bidirectional [NiFe] hydrogenase diaphorase subunit
LGLTHTRIEHAYPQLPVDVSHRHFVHDPNRCILCTRCVRVCKEIEGAQVWGTAFRGTRSRLILELDSAWSEVSSCTNCGKCVQVCPTGAMAEKGFGVEEMDKESRSVARLAIKRGAHV